MDKLVDAVRALNQHGIWEIASAVSQIILALLACLTALFAYAQIRQLSADSATRTRQLKANFLFELDKLFESEAFAVARAELNRRCDEINLEVSKDAPQLDTDGKHTLFGEKFSVLLHALKQQSSPEYHRLMKLAGFFETAGKLAYSGYIDKNDIFDLYRFAIKSYYRATAQHIRKRQVEEAAPDLYEHFLKLALECEK